MKTDPNQMRSGLRSVIAKVEEKKLQHSHGISVELSPLDDVIGGMISNAKVHDGNTSLESVFTVWHSAKAADDAYNDPSNNPDARPLSKADLKQLDGYIASAKSVAIDYLGTVRSLASAIENQNLEEALKLAESVGSRENIAEIANDHDITVPGHKKSMFDEPEPDEVIHRLDELCEDRFLAAANKDMEAVELKPCSRDSYGEPIKWEPGTKVADLDQSGKGLAEMFIDEARANGEIAPAKKKPTTFGKNRTRADCNGLNAVVGQRSYLAGTLHAQTQKYVAAVGSAEQCAAHVAHLESVVYELAHGETARPSYDVKAVDRLPKYLREQVGLGHVTDLRSQIKATDRAESGPFAGDGDIDSLAAEEAKLDRAEQRARETARLDVEPEKPRSTGLNRE